VRRPSAALLAAALLAVATSAAAAQTMTSPAPRASAAVHPIRIVLAADTFAGLVRRTITVSEEHGGTAVYSGFELGAVLARAGAPSGKGIAGAALASYVVVRASDGYRAVFALPELDPAFTDRIALLVDQRGGAPLPPQLEPYRIVVAGEKRAARWVRNVTEIDVEPVP